MNLGGVVHLNKKSLCIIIGICVIIILYILSNNNTSESLHYKQVNLRRLLTISIKAAQNGGFEVVQTKDNLKTESKGKTKEGMNDPVTTADFKSHCSMKSTLKHSFPSLIVISEEATTVCDKNQLVDFSNPINVNLDDLHESWINEDDIRVWVDPLDATQEYTEKMYKYVTTMVCVAVKGIPIIGVIHKPFSGETSWAWVGNGKSQNLNTVQNSANSKLRFIISRSHSGTVKEVLKNAFSDRETDFIIAAGAGYKILEVISGNADAYVHNTAIKKWDICAGNAILNSVGGKMTTKNNNIIDYSEVTNVLNQDGLIATMKDHELLFGKL